MTVAEARSLARGTAVLVTGTPATFLYLTRNSRLGLLAVVETPTDGQWNVPVRSVAVA